MWPWLPVNSLSAMLNSVYSRKLPLARSRFWGVARWRHEPSSAGRSALHQNKPWSCAFVPRRRWFSPFTISQSCLQHTRRLRPLGPLLWGRLHTLGVYVRMVGCLQPAGATVVVTLLVVKHGNRRRPTLTSSATATTTTSRSVSHGRDCNAIMSDPSSATTESWCQMLRFWTHRKIGCPSLARNVPE